MSEVVKVERRRALRYRKPGGAIAVGGMPAQMTDLSAIGVGFKSAQRFTPGDEVAIVLPLYEGNTDLRVTRDARIVRVEQRGDVYMVGATYELLPCPMPKSARGQ